MAKDDELTIELDLDEKPEGTETPETKVAVPPEVPKVDDAVAALKKQLEEKDARLADSDARRIAAENTARQVNERSQTDVRAANLNMVTGAIETVKRETEILEANYANAMANQDWTGAAKIQTALATAASKLVQLETGKEAMEVEAKQPVRRMEHSADPVETLAAQLSPKSAAWVRAHPEYARDPRLTQRMVAAHNLAVTDNLAADSDSYFEHVENTLGLRKQAVLDKEDDDDDDALSEASQPVARRSAPPAAPVSRSGTGNGKNSTRITLTAQEREIAEMNGMTDREYALQKAKLIKEGKIH